MKIPKTESKKVEFKSTFNHDVIVSLVAFANADGGDVYVGVRDDGKVVGVQLASLFKAVGLTERYGSGIKRIEDACRRHGRVRVKFENHETWFKVVLLKVDGEKRTGERPQKKLGEKLGENRRRIISMMIQNPSVTTFDLVAGIGISQTAIENNITWLRSHGYVRRVGPDKGGHWEVIDKMES